jgi:tRNA (cytidine/uridine-2'-O-)-methyltransferase
MMQLALFEPDIAANAAAAMRLAACLEVPLHVIEPCGFAWDPVRLRRVGLDYLDHAHLVRHPAFAAFEEARRRQGTRLVLLTTAADLRLDHASFRPGDIVMGGRESGGVPEAVHAAADLRLRIPIAAGRRSLNLVTALAIALGEGLRQTRGWPPG